MALRATHERMRSAKEQLLGERSLSKQSSLSEQSSEQSSVLDLATIDFSGKDKSRGASPTRVN